MTSGGTPSTWPVAWKVPALREKSRYVEIADFIVLQFKYCPPLTNVLTPAGDGENRKDIAKTLLPLHLCGNESHQGCRDSSARLHGV